MRVTTLVLCYKTIRYTISKAQIGVSNKQTLYSNQALWMFDIGSLKTFWPNTGLPNRRKFPAKKIIDFFSLTEPFYYSTVGVFGNEIDEYGIKWNSRNNKNITVGNQELRRNCTGSILINGTRYSLFTTCKIVTFWKCNLSASSSLDSTIKLFSLILTLILMLFLKILYLCRYKTI